MATHKFRVGQKVWLVATRFDRYIPAGEYEVVRQLPKSDGEFQYRIKGSHEAHERVVKESQLRKSFDA
jgi:hypothetical protein